MIHSKHSKQGFGGVDPDAPHQMIPEKCSPKNAPQNKMLPGKKWFPSKCSPSKCSPKKMLLQKNAPQKNSLDLPIIYSVDTWIFSGGAFFPGEHFDGEYFFRGAFCFGEHFLESIFRGAFGGEHFFGEHLGLHHPKPIPSISPPLKINLNPSKNGWSRSHPRIGPIINCQILPSMLLEFIIRMKYINCNKSKYLEKIRFHLKVPTTKAWIIYTILEAP